MVSIYRGQGGRAARKPVRRGQLPEAFLRHLHEEHHGRDGPHRGVRQEG